MAGTVSSVAARRLNSASSRQGAGGSWAKDGMVATHPTIASPRSEEVRDIVASPCGGSLDGFGDAFKSFRLQVTGAKRL